MLTDHETVYGSDDDYYSDGYDPIWEARIHGLEAVTMIQLSDGEEVEMITLSPNTPMIEAGTIETEVLPVEPTIVDFFYQFVSSVEKSCKRVKKMINYYYWSNVSKTDPLPYPGLGTIVCTRLELESEMRRVSPKLHQEFLIELSGLRVRWMVRNHVVSNRCFSEANITWLMYESYVGKYVCVNDGRSNMLWMFDDTRWMEISAAEIWQEMSTSFIDFVRTYQHGNDKWELLCDDIARYMSSVASRERIQRDLLYRLTNISFQSKLNSNTHLIGMANGIYDLEKQRLRNALPMDYVSMSTNINYLEEDDEELREELEDILRTIFPNKRVRKFFVQSCASLLEGRNKEKRVYVWWGKGNNAKSMMEKLLATALGDYSTVAATSLVTGKRGNVDNASPQLAALEGKLSVFLQEPNPNETIKIGMVKELSGNDAITARALYKGNRTYTPKFKLVIVCNAPIEIPNIDVAFTERLIVIPFESTFRTKEDYRRRKKKGTLTKYDHLMDATLAGRITDYAEVFFRMLVEEFHEIGDESLRVPKRVRRATNEYIKANNFALRFIEEQCTEVDDGEVGIKSLHSELKSWMNEHHGGKKVPNIDIFREQVVECGYDVDNRGVVHGLIVSFD